VVVWRTDCGQSQRESSFSLSAALVGKLNNHDGTSVCLADQSDIAKKDAARAVAHAAITLRRMIPCLFANARDRLGGLLGRVGPTFPLASIPRGLPIFVAPPIITVLPEGG